MALVIGRFGIRYNRLDNNIYEHRHKVSSSDGSSKKFLEYFIKSFTDDIGLKKSQKSHNY